jgi:N-methylhydantoinase B
VFRVLADEARICLCTDRHATPPPGLAGGEPGACSRYVIDPGTPDEQVLGSKTGYVKLRQGALVWLQSAGGGGYGPPSERDPALRARDLHEGYVTK